MADLRELPLRYGMSIGCDPELFVTRQAGIVRKRVAPVGSEKIIGPLGYPEGFAADYPHVTRDGVQVELHAQSGWCRQALASNISSAIQYLAQAVVDARKMLKDPSLAVSFAPLVTLSKTDLKMLSPESQELGCRESFNAYGREHIKRDGKKYLIRTASGHVHVGSGLFTRRLVDIDEAVKIFDLIVGIFCVLLDQDPSQKIRRETYGRAGEYRLPQHGLEYRVPSNFWLKDYKLQSGVFGMARIALQVCEGLVKSAPADNKWALKTLRAKAPGDAEVERVINENDFEGALRIYQDCIRPLGQGLYAMHGIGAGLMDPLDYFIETVHERGLGQWIDIRDSVILANWQNPHFDTGWERFLSSTVEPKRRASAFKGIILDPEKAMKEPGILAGVTVARRRSRAELPATPYPGPDATPFRIAA